MTNEVLMLVLSFVMLYFGAEFALDGSEKIGERLGMSPLVIGMLLVGIGTSLPEFFVSHIACLDNKPAMAIGGLVGSNIANIYLILGICSLIIPLGLSSKELRPQLIMHLVLYIVAAPFLFQKNFNSVASIFLFAFILFYLVSIFKQMKKYSSVNPVDPASLADYNYFLLGAKMLVGFVLLFYGGDFLVESVSAICKSLGVSEYVISAILVAFGTSFPELVTALIAALKKKDQNLIVGNIIGSNVFNLGLILGTIGPYDFPISMSLGPEFFLLFFAAIYLIFLSYKGFKLNKIGGIMFLLMYGKMVLQWLK
jgi:cation:H+ antiporter